MEFAAGVFGGVWERSQVQAWFGLLVLMADRHSEGMPASYLDDGFHAHLAVDVYLCEAKSHPLIIEDQLCFRAHRMGCVQMLLVI